MSVIDLKKYLTAGWAHFDSYIGCYTHKGRLYLTGEVTSVTGSVTQTILSGIPPAFRPPADVELTLPIDPRGTTDVANRVLNLDLRYAAVMTKAGDLKLVAAIPPGLNEVPSAAEWFYETGRNADEEGAGAEPWVKHPEFTVGGGEFFSQRAPFKLTLVTGNASWTLSSDTDLPSFLSLAAFLAADVTDTGAAEYALHGSRIHLGGSVTANKDQAEELLSKNPPGTEAGIAGNDMTTVELGGQPLGAEVAVGFGVQIPNDIFIKAASETPPLATYPRLLQGVGPAAGPGEKVTRNRHHGPTQECPVYEHLNEPCGSITHYELCHHPYIGNVSASLNIADLLPLCLPEPDWFLVILAADVGVGPEDGECEELVKEGPIEGCDYTGLFGEKIDCALGCADKVAKKASSLAAGPIVYSNTGGEQPPGPLGSGGTGLRGYLKPPASLYKGAHDVPEAPFIPGLLWSPAQAAVVTVEFHQEGFCDCAMELSLAITPYYERRQLGVHNGDVIDLSKTGWEGDVGELAIGPSRGGRVPSREAMGLMVAAS